MKVTVDGKERKVVDLTGDCTIDELAFAVAEDYADFIRKNYNSLEDYFDEIEAESCDFEEEVLHVAHVIIESDYINSIEINYDCGEIYELEDLVSFLFGAETVGYSGDFDIVDSVTFEEFTKLVIAHIEEICRQIWI